MRVTKTALATALVLGGWAAAHGVANADPAAPGPKTDISGDGTYKVGTDIAPGNYASAGPANSGTCSWKRAGADNKTIDNAISHKAQIVTIDATDATFKTSGCQAWTLTDAAPPAPISNLQGQAMMALLGGLGSGLGGGGGLGAQAPAAPQAPAPQGTGPAPGPASAAAPAPQGTGPVPGPAPGVLLPAEAPGS